MSIPIGSIRLKELYSRENYVKFGWSPRLCSYLKIQYTDGVSTISKKRGGKLVSDSFVNSGTPIEWECANGHRWFAKYDHIKNDSWCPICSAGLSENITRLILERITEKPLEYQL
jgi:hypothetical protein